MPRGSCLCGEVSWESGELSVLHHCHCSICRRATGSNGIAVVVVDNDAFRWTQGQDQITTWRKPGADWENCFCRVCGSTVPVPNDDARMAIPAGLIANGGGTLKVAAHIFVDSKAVWDEIGDTGRRYPAAFGVG